MINPFIKHIFRYFGILFILCIIAIIVVTILKKYENRCYVFKDLQNAEISQSNNCHHLVMDNFNPKQHNTQLKNFLKDNTKLIEININVQNTLNDIDNNIKSHSDLSLTHIITGLENINLPLTDLSLQGLIISDQSATSLANALKKNKILITLTLNYRYLSNTGTKSLADALKTNTALTTLTLHGNDIGDPGTKSLADALRENTTLTTIYLYSNSIGVSGAAILADALKKNTALTTLDLYDNNIADAGAKSLADALRENTTLESLRLYRNNINNPGAGSLADALKTNTALTTLDLDKNNIGDDGAGSLADALRENTTLESLYLGNNNIGDAGAKSFADALETCNRTLTRITFDPHDKYGNTSSSISLDIKQNIEKYIKRNDSWFLLSKKNKCIDKNTIKIGFGYYILLFLLGGFIIYSILRKIFTKNKKFFN